ncbi:hypothetical protein [Stenomitos frigidus]|uniref:hypothetical protein n=1 Tax=Stenomitos frigidus TaxID=1886765 RepID=UPI0011B214F0|nr:hypothetical protein [Stenomitos frigidus]
MLSTFNATQLQSTSSAATAPSPTPLSQLPQHPLHHRIIREFIRALLLDDFFWHFQEFGRIR